jgi:hypothetical protein
MVVGSANKRHPIDVRNEERAVDDKLFLSQLENAKRRFQAGILNQELREANHPAAEPLT